MSNPINRALLTYRQSTSAIILDNNKQLLIVQKTSYHDNEWDIPGGGVEDGESPETAILRELAEELGSSKFKITKKSCQINQYDWPDEVIAQRLAEKGKTYRGQQRIQFFVNFFGHPSEIKPDPDEIRTVKWVALDKLENYLIFPNQLSKLKLVLEKS